MGDTTLSPTNLLQIEVGASADSWGDKLNDNFAIINTLLSGLKTGVQTYTPAVTASSVAPTGVTYSTQIGRWVDLGPIAIVQISIVMTSKGASGSGQVRVSLPFTTTAVAAPTMAHSQNTTGVATGSIVTGLVDNGANYVNMRVQANNGSNPLDWTGLLNTWQIIMTVVAFKAV